jgi:hypothetical protein
MYVVQFTATDRRATSFSHKHLQLKRVNSVARVWGIYGLCVGRTNKKYISFLICTFLLWRETSINAGKP